MLPIRDHNPTGRTAYVTYALIAANILVFLAMLPAYGDERMLAKLYYQWGLVPVWVVHGEHLSGLVTSMFLHGGFMHLAGNMLFLWIFGDNMEDELGHVRFVLFYIASGLGAAALQIIADPTSQIPMIGASGAIAGVMGGYLLLFPKARVDVLFIFVVFFRVFPVPAWIMLVVWFGLQVVSGMLGDASAGGIAYWAHAGGFMVGILWVLPRWIRRGGPQYWAQTDGRPPHPKTRYRLNQSRIPSVRRRK